MKYIFSIALMISCFACVKTVGDKKDAAEASSLTRTNTTLKSKYLVKDLGATVLTVTMDPVVTCYSYGNGEIPKPCNIFVDVTCNLSNPVDGSVTVAIEKSNVVNSIYDNGNGTDGQPDETNTMVFNISPNQTKIVFHEVYTNQNNLNIPDDYKIVDARVYKMVY